MQSLFNYENKVMQMLMVVGDLIILNVLFLLCCIPIVTVGAAQAGLYSGIRVLTDKEDDTPCAAAFFKGFSNGFMRITPVWCILLVLLLASCVSLLPMDLPEGVFVLKMPVAVSVLGIAFSCIFISLTSWFHARFECTTFQLFKNAWLIFLAHPLRSVLIAAINAIPLIILLTNFYLFMELTPIFLAVGFSVQHLAAFTIMKKPFQDLLQMYQERNGAEETESPEEQEEDRRIFHDELLETGEEDQK